MEKEYNFIYLITNKTNSKKYLGKHSTNNLNDGYCGSGNNIKKAILKYGIDNFDIKFLRFFETSVLAYRAERLLGTLLKISERNDFYNLNNGGEGNRGGGWKLTEAQRLKISKGLTGRNLSDKHRENIGKKSLGRLPWNKGKKNVYSEEVKLNISIGLRKYFENNIVSDETRLKLSFAGKGRTSAMKGRKHKPETIELMKISNTLSRTEEVKSRISEGMKEACKLRPIVKCPHCDKEGASNGMKRFHFDNCPQNVNTEMKKFKCPHCGYESRSIGNIKQYHFDNCKKVKFI